jgi:pimeloyl-ACP methyl ester carboxylesterase
LTTARRAFKIVCGDAAVRPVPVLDPESAMNHAALTLLLLVAVPEKRTETRLEQVAPVPRNGELMRTRDRDRAVLLIHGLKVHPVQKEKVDRAELHAWQTPDAALVRKLGQEADVFAFAYAQNVAVDRVAELPDLADAVARLKRLGYKEVVLIGHSAGGLVARNFVEDHPDAGVAKVIQVCVPNGGSSLASVAVARSEQRAYIESLSKQERDRVRKERADKRIPAQVEFVVVVGNGLGEGDGVVRVSSQWTEDLARQGIPAVTLSATHRDALRGEAGVELINRLVRERQPRWDEGHVEWMRKELFGK